MNRDGLAVYVVDDEASMRKALKRLLGVAGFEVRVFGSAREFFAAYDPRSLACLVLDVSMPGVDGIDIQKQLAAAGDSIPIIFLTGHGDIPMSVRAMKAGAVDFLTKPVRDDELLNAVNAALDLAVMRRAEESALAEWMRRYHLLTPRERDVMGLVVAGKLNKQIAAELGTGEQNIKIHRGRVMEKMGLQSLAELVRVAGKLLIRQTGHAAPAGDYERASREG